MGCGGVGAGLQGRHCGAQQHATPMWALCALLTLDRSADATCAREEKWVTTYLCTTYQLSKTGWRPCLLQQPPHFCLVAVADRLTSHRRDGR